MVKAYSAEEKKYRDEKKPCKTCGRSMVVRVWKRGIDREKCFFCNAKDQSYQSFISNYNS